MRRNNNTVVARCPGLAPAPRHPPLANTTQHSVPSFFFYFRPFGQEQQDSLASAQSIRVVPVPQSSLDHLSVPSPRGCDLLRDTTTAVGEKERMVYHGRHEGRLGDIRPRGGFITRFDDKFLSEGWINQTGRLLPVSVGLCYSSTGYIVDAALMYRSL